MVLKLEKKIMNKDFFYKLSDVRGKYNPRCHMFGCEPKCTIESYKINNQKKLVALLIWSSNFKTILIEMN